MNSARRRWIAGVGSAALCACAAPALVGCATASARRPGVLREVGPGVYAVIGAGGEPDVDNQGRTGNAGFIVGPAGVLAIDTGTSHAHGLALLDAVASVTALPVRHAVLTHARQEFVFGATAYQARGISLTMHRRAAQLMRARCDRCLKNLQRLLGDAAMRGTAIASPDLLIDADRTLDLIGRPVRLLTYTHASGPGDVAVLDPATRTVFAGGLVDVQRIPDVMDADLEGWRAALAALQAEVGTGRIVPGHGGLGGARSLDDVRGYLDALEARVRGLLDDGVALSAVPVSADLPQYAGWDLYATLHRRNAAVLYIRLEREQLTARGVGTGTTSS